MFIGLFSMISSSSSF